MQNNDYYHKYTKTYSFQNTSTHRLHFLSTFLKCLFVLPFVPNEAAICTKRAAHLVQMATPNRHFQIVIWA